MVSVGPYVVDLHIDDGVGDDDDAVGADGVGNDDDNVDVEDCVDDDVAKVVDAACRLRSLLTAQTPFWLLLFIGNFINLTIQIDVENVNDAHEILFENFPTKQYQSAAELPRPILASMRVGRQQIIEDVLNTDRSSKPSLMDIALQISARQGLDAMTELYTKIEPDMIRNGQLLEENHPASLLSKFSAPTTDAPKPNPEMAAFAVITATKAFRKNYKFINDLARQAHSPKISLRRTALESLCPPRDPPTCMPASERYRTHDGTCNNKRRPRWGSSQMPFNRFLPPVYGDGVDSIRNSVEGGPLSSSRFVSLLVHGAKDGEAPLTLMIAQWGQLLDHDMTSTAQPRSINGSVPSCCGGSDFHPSCFPIKVPLDDPWLAPLKVRCLEFLRSAPAQRRDCVLSWREQTNQATSFIDASPIYANSAKASDNGRVFRNGLLIYGRGDPAQDVCLRGAMASQCIRAGDGRSSEQPGLLALHHVWVSEHNRIALELGDLNQHWSDEKIYQETRRIVGAMFQHITYREFLPLILGKEVCKLFELELLNAGYFNGYDPKTNPTVANSFAAAAFRFGHSLIQNSYMRCDRHHNIISNNVSLHEEFQRGDIGSAGSLHRLLRGMATQRALKRDEFITPELTNHLFQTPGFPFGLDLAAINIQRGRDHGIPPYTAWRIPCGLSKVNSWDDFENVVGPESAQRVRHAYRSVHDIDLFVGGIAERPVIGGLVGPTFACIIAQQFSNSRKGDRFWYENGKFESAFTPAQLHALRRVSLAQVLCRSVGGGTFQPHIFIPPGFEGNDRLPCGVGPLAPIDLSAWREQDPFIEPSRIQHAQTNLATQNPDRVFEIVSGNLGPSNAQHTVHVIKDDKAGFQNRVRPVSTGSNVLSSNIPQVDLIPNASIGLHRPKNLTKINDKLDIHRKGTTTRRPSQNSHIVSGVNNKLDSNTRININIKGINRHRMHTTTRRTVIVNNVPIELRNSEGSTEPGPTSDENFETETELNNNMTTTRTSTITTTTTQKPLTTKRKKNKKRKNRPKTAKPHIARLDVENEDVIPRPVTVEDILVFHDNEPNTEDSSTLKAEDIFDIFDSFTEPTKLDSDDTFTDFTTKLEDDSSREDLQDSEEAIEAKLAHDNDIDPLLTAKDLPDNKRVQRQITKTKDLTKLVTSRNTTKIRPVTAVQTLRLAPKNLTLLNLSTTSRTAPKVFSSHFSTTMTATNPSTTSARTTTTRIRPKKTTQANVELRQYQTGQAYTRPHKVVVKGPNSDAYEIEINIRQTSAGPVQRPLTTNNYAEFLTSNIYQPYNNYDRYSPNYLNYMTTTTPAYMYYRPQPTASPQYGLMQRPTKPPTVIYLNENDRDERTTTRQPNIFQNFLSFATNSLRPTPISSPNSGQKERPGASYHPNGPLSANQANYQYGTVSQNVYPAGASSLSQSGGIHATSSAVSTGNFGAIFGVASANGGDSTFSFNIRPKPSVSNIYNPVSSPRPIFNQVAQPEYVNLPISTATSKPYNELPYREPANSPFSTHKRPHHSDYTNRDYDYSSRSFLADPLSNVSSSNDNASDEYQYDDNDDISDENVPPAKKYDRDGYLRPEHMLKHLLRVKDNNRQELVTKNDSLDDNFVLPMMANLSFGLIEIPRPIPPLKNKNLVPNLTMELTELPDTNAKNLNNDIQAESNDETDVSTEPILAMNTTAQTTVKKALPSIAFAPIKVLTKPERPDNWIIFDTHSKSPPLPDPPEVQIDTASINEVPKPLLDQAMIWLKKDDQQSSMRDKEGSETEPTPG